MPILPVNHLYGLFGGGHPVNWARNGIGPPGAGAKGLADQINFLLAGRTKCLFAKAIPVSEAFSASAASEDTLWSFACHTSPVTGEVMTWLVCLPADSPDSNYETYTYWTTETELTGSGTSTNRPRLYFAGTSTTTTPADYIYLGPQRFSVNADADYRFTLKVRNKMRVIGAVIYEIPRFFVNTASDANALDASKFFHLAHVHDAPVLDLLEGIDKAWKRCGSQIFSWCVNGRSGIDADAITRTPNTAVNILDTSHAAYAAAAPGFLAYPHYHGSLDSANVGATFYAYGRVTAGSCDVTFRNASGIVATITFTETAATWKTATANLTSTNTREKIDVLIKGPGGTDTGYLWNVGSFFHVA